MIVLNTLDTGKMSSVMKSDCELDMLALRGSSCHLMTPRCSDRTITVVPRPSAHQIRQIMALTIIAAGTRIDHCTQNALKRRLPAHELDLAQVELPILLEQEEVLALHDEESQHVSSYHQNLLRGSLCDTTEHDPSLGYGQWLTAPQPVATVALHPRRLSVA